MMSLKIKKRGGEDVAFNPQKIYNRIKRAAKGLTVNSDEIFIKVITSVPTEGNITTKELDKKYVRINYIQPKANQAPRPKKERREDIYFKDFLNLNCPF